MYNYPNNNYPTYNNAYYTSSLKDMRDQIDRQLQQQQQMQHFFIINLLKKTPLL